MLLKLSYLYENEAKAIECTCSNYTFGLPMLYARFKEQHSQSLNELVQAGLVKDVKINSFYNDQWHELSYFYYKVGNKKIITKF